MNNKNEYQHRLTGFLERLGIEGYRFEEHAKSKAIVVPWKGKTHTVFFSKTGSDWRGAKNTVRDLRRALGITKADFTMLEKPKPVGENSFKVLEALKPQSEVKPVEHINGNGNDLRDQIAKYKEENAKLRLVPTPQPDLGARVTDVLEQNRDRLLTLKQIAQKACAMEPSVSYHLHKLRKANTVMVEAEGVLLRYQLKPPTLIPVTDKKPAAAPPRPPSSDAELFAAAMRKMARAKSILEGGDEDGLLAVTVQPLLSMVIADVQTLMARLDRK
jgi:hypothetical protein